MRPREREIDKLLRATILLEGSELHLAVERPPFVLAHGTLRPMNRGPLTGSELTHHFLPLLDARAERTFEQSSGVDVACTCECKDVRYLFRVSLFRQRGHAALVARRMEIS